MKKIVIIGAYGCKNLGDEAILSGLLKTLKKNDIVVFSSNPEETQKLHNVKSEYENLKRIILWSDEIIIGGGELFQDHMAKKFCRLIILAKLFGKKIKVSGVGIDLNKIFIKFFTKLALKIADEISVRDKRSFQNLIKLGIKTEKIKLTKDFAFNLTFSDPTEKIKNFYDKVIRKNPYLILVLRPVNHKTDEVIISFFTKFIKYLIKKKKIKIILFPFSKHPFSSQDNDLTILKKIKTKLGNEKIILFDQEITPTDALWIISKSEQVVSMRLHPLIFSKIAQTKAVAISSFAKVKSFAKEHHIPFIEIQNLSKLYNLLS